MSDDSGRGQGGVWDTPGPIPGESAEDYTKRLSDHHGRQIEFVLAEYAKHGVEPPEWVAALGALVGLSDG